MAYKYTGWAVDCYATITLLRIGPKFGEGKSFWQFQPHVLNPFVVGSSLSHNEFDQHTSFFP